MACGPIVLNPQIISTAMAMLGQPAGLPADLSLVMNGTQPEMKMEVLCDASNKPVGWSVERYFDTKTRFTNVVPLDDGEVDEQTSYVVSLADGRVAQKLTVRLDSEYKLAQYGVESLCGGNKPNALVCTSHVPTIQSLGLSLSKGAHADWMQTFVPEVGSGGEYVFVSAAEYPQAKKEAEDKKKAANTPPPAVPSVVPSVIPSVVPPVVSTNPPVTNTGAEEATSPITPLNGGLMALCGVLGLATGVSLLKLRASNRQVRRFRKKLNEVADAASKPPVQGDRPPKVRLEKPAKVARPEQPAAPAEPIPQQDDIADALAEMDSPSAPSSEQSSPESQA